MAERTTATVELGRIGRKLSSWRERHGGRGRALPEKLWAEAAEVAAVAGVNEAARVLGVDRERLARRMQSVRAGHRPRSPCRRAGRLRAQRSSRSMRIECSHAVWRWFD